MSASISIMRHESGVPALTRSAQTVAVVRQLEIELWQTSGMLRPGA
jgi:hypothetical protein